MSLLSPITPEVGQRTRDGFLSSWSTQQAKFAHQEAKAYSTKEFLKKLAITSPGFMTLAKPEFTRHDDGYISVKLAMVWKPAAQYVGGLVDMLSASYALHLPTVRNGILQPPAFCLFDFELVLTMAKVVVAHKKKPEDRNLCDVAKFMMLCMTYPATMFVPQCPAFELVKMIFRGMNSRALDAMGSKGLQDLEYTRNMGEVVYLLAKGTRKWATDERERERVADEQQRISQVRWVATE